MQNAATGISSPGGRKAPAPGPKKPKIKIAAGSVIAQCAGCGETFRSEKGFSLHRTGTWDERRCMTPAEMCAIGMSRSDRGHWITVAGWGGQNKEEHGATE